jgi:hypothetical protein
MWRALIGRDPQTVEPANGNARIKDLQYRTCAGILGCKRRAQLRAEIEASTELLMGRRGSRATQYNFNITIITFQINITAITPATESHTASAASL